MPDTWTHQAFGKFQHDGIAWIAPVAAPAFDRFHYDDVFSSGNRPKKGSARYELSLAPSDDDGPPSADVVAVAERVMANLDALAALVTSALWDDFNGRGGESGMWWHGDLDQVAEGLEDAELTPPKKADDMFKLMNFAGIRVHPSGHRFKKPIAELYFGAAFEEEHGVGVLTDGERILGTGYSLDVTPFKDQD